MPTWRHAGFHVHMAVWVSEDDRALATRLARYCARNPVALDRLTHDRATKAVTYRSDKSEGPHGRLGRHATTPQRPFRPTESHLDAPRPRAGPFGVRVRPTGALGDVRRARQTHRGVGGRSACASDPIGPRCDRAPT